MLFELDAAKLKPLRSRTNRFTHLAEYPETDYDISMLFEADARWADIYDAILGKKKASAPCKCPMAIVWWYLNRECLTMVYQKLAIQGRTGQDHGLATGSMPLQA